MEMPIPYRIYSKVLQGKARDDAREIISVACMQTVLDERIDR